MPEEQILARLSSFIDRESPELSSFLYRMWDDQQQAITYKELRQAILSGELLLEYLNQWQQDYSKFLIDAYTPNVERAILQAANDLRREYGPYFLDPVSPKIDLFIKTNGGRLIREVTRQQYQAINTLVRQASLTEIMTVDELARAIRPCIGLTSRQAQQTQKYFETLVDGGLSPKKAQEKQLVFAAKLHRQRAATIAQTEMAFAYNAGLDASVQQSIEDGILPQTVKEQWLTALDERVCPVCGKMHGETVDIGKPFSFGGTGPPAHPNCRCCKAILFDTVQNTVNLKEAFAYVHDLPEERRTEILGGKTKRALFDADMLEPEDYFKPLREINTDGIILPSRAALNHANVGEYTGPRKKYPGGRMTGGGHGQDSFQEMNGRGISYHITATAPNGVRFGNVIGHTTLEKATMSKQSWFPPEWTREDIRSAGLYVANKGTAVSSFTNGKVAVYHGVKVQVRFNSRGQISTIFPDYTQ